MVIQGYRYFIRVFISRRMAEVVKEKDIWVHSFRMPPDSNNSIKMEVGIEDCLHIEFEYNKSKYVMTNIQVLLSSLQQYQISFERCYCWQNLLPPGSNKDQAYGVVYHPS
jgi:hypothetical protein